MSAVEKTEQLEAMVPPTLEDIPFFLVSQPDRKISKLISNSPLRGDVKSQNREFEFSFIEPVVLHDVLIETSDFADGSKFEWSWTGIDGRKFHGESYSRSNEISLPITGIVKSISFKPPKSYFTTPFIKTVSLYGFEISKAEIFAKFAENLQSHKNNIIQTIKNELLILDEKRTEIAALQAQRGSIQQDIQALKSAYTRENNKNKKLDAERIDLQAEIHALRTNLGISEKSLTDSKFHLRRLTDLRSNLSKSVTEKKRLLSELQSNIDLFPSELSSFSSQGSKDTRTFFRLSYIPIVIILTVFCLLIFGAADLSTKITGSEEVNITALIVSRLPYVATSLTIATICYYIVRMLILEIIRISRQRLALTKISIIAKDISNSIDHDLELSEDERYNKRLILKMDLMKNHLKEYISTDFTPTLPQQISTLTNLISQNAIAEKNQKEKDDS